MPACKPEIKKLLMDKGSWADFVFRRDEHRVSGLSSTEAHWKALEEFLTPEEMPVRRVAKPKKSKPNPTEKPSLAPSRREPGTTQVKYPSTARPDRFVSISEFEGRTANEATIIRWVGKHMYVCDVTPADCPDPTAWNMWQQCQISPIFCAEFWKTIYTKIVPAKSSFGDNDGDADKDKPDKTEEMVEMIILISEECKRVKKPDNSDGIDEQSNS